MAEQELAKANGGAPAGAKGDFSNYNPLEINLGVFWTAKSLGDKTTLSLNYVRDYVKLNFSMTTDDGKKEQVFKKFKLSEAFVIANALRTIIADRLATLNNFIESGAEGAPNYSELPEDGFTFHTHYFDKQKGEDVTNGKITISTIPVNGINRIVIKGYSETEMQQIRVVFYDDVNDRLRKVSQASIIDGGDLDLYRLGMEIEQALKKTFEYACADKIYQAVIAGKSYSNSNNNFQQKKSFGFFNKNTQRQVSVNDSSAGSNESGVDLFDQDVDY